MKFKSLALAATLVAGAGSAFTSTAALAQEKVQFFPVLSGRTGPVARLSP